MRQGNGLAKAVPKLIPWLRFKQQMNRNTEEGERDGLGDIETDVGIQASR